MAEAWQGGSPGWAGGWGKLSVLLLFSLLALLVTWKDICPTCSSHSLSRLLLQHMPAMQRSSATTGRLFAMTGKPLYGETWMESWLARAQPPAEPPEASDDDSCSVPLIGVVSTLKVRLPVIDALLQRYPGAEVIVVGDEGSQPLILQPSFKARIHNLGVTEQHRLYPKLSRTLPLRSFSRKNVGYVHAVALGACYIWDFDDDNFIHSADGVAVLDVVAAGGKLTSSQLLGSILTPNASAVNPYFMFGPDRFVYPRGYPRQPTTSGNLPAMFSVAARKLADWEIDVVQVVQNISADVDADWRINNPGPLYWEPPLPLSSGKSLVAIDPSSLAPYNAQATLVSRRAVFSLYLPFTVNGRVSDIWRSYFAQGVLPAMAGLVAFAAPAVEHLRNPHSNLADFDAEIPLYTRAQAFVDFIQEWRSRAEPSVDLGVALVQLYAQAASQGIFDNKAEEELAGLLEYLSALRKLSYTMPRARSVLPAVPAPPRVEPFDNVLAVVHINHALSRGIPLWQAMHPELPRAVYYLPGASPCPTVNGLKIVCLSNDIAGFFAYESAFHAYRSNPSFPFYLFSHEDAVLRPASLRCMVESGFSFRPPDDPYNSNTSANWPWSPGVDATISALKAAGSLPPCAAGPDAWFFKGGAGDLFFATGRDMEAMASASELYRRENLFLEVAVPTLFRCYAPSSQELDMLQEFNSKRYDNYDPVYFRKRFCKSRGNDYVHPIKFSTDSGVRQYMLACQCPLPKRPTSGCLAGKFTK